MAQTEVLQLESGMDLTPRGPYAHQRFTGGHIQRAHGDFYAEKINMGERVRLEERFEKRPALNAVLALDENSNAAAHAAAQIANKDFEVLGTNMTTALCTHEVEGGIRMTTAGADADKGILAPHLDTGQTAWTAWTWGTDRETRYYVNFKIGSALTKTVVWAGLKLTNTDVIATDDEQIFLRYEVGVNGEKFGIQISRAGTDAALVDTGITPVINTAYRLGIVIKADRTVDVFLDGTKHVDGAAAMTDAIDLIPYVGVMAKGAAPGAKFLIVRACAISRKAA